MDLNPRTPITSVFDTMFDTMSLRADCSHVSWPRQCLLLLAGLVCAGAVFAQAPEVRKAPAVPDAQAWLQLSPHEKAERREQLRRQLDQVSPEERKAFRKQMRERLQSLTPEERRQLAQQARQRWNAMSPQERERMAAERRARIEAMTPEQRRALMQQRRAMLEQLSPEERAALREKLPAR